MSEEKEISVQEVKDLFSIQIVLNNLLDKYNLVVAEQKSLIESFNELKKANEALTNKQEELIQAIANMSEIVKNNDSLIEDNKHLRSDNNKLTKIIKKIDSNLSNAESAATASEEVKEEKPVRKKKTNEKQEKAQELLKICKQQKKSILKLEEVSVMLKLNHAEGQEMFRYLKDAGYLSRDLKINYEKLK